MDRCIVFIDTHLQFMMMIGVVNVVLQFVSHVYPLSRSSQGCRWFKLMIDRWRTAKPCIYMEGRDLGVKQDVIITVPNAT